MKGHVKTRIVKSGFFQCEKGVFKAVSPFSDALKNHVQTGTKKRKKFVISVSKLWRWNQTRMRQIVKNLYAT